MDSYSLVPPQPPIEYEARLSATMAVVLMLPMLPLASRFPGMGPWLERLARRLSHEEKSDLRLMTLVSGSVLAEPSLAERGDETPDALLERLRALPAEEIRAAAFRRFRPADDVRKPAELLQHPDELRRMILSVEPPSPEDPFPLNLERALRLLGNPEQLKATLAETLSRLWLHLKPEWQRDLPAMTRSCAAIRRHFGAGDPESVIRLVTGRSLPEHMVPRLHRVRRVEFVPVPFLGPYVAYFEMGDMLRVAYGVGRESTGGPTTGGSVPGGLLPVMTALADETRLQILAYLREREKGCAQDFMTAFALSQPATSRHMRLLESTGLVWAERVDGIKWYAVDARRAGEVVRALAEFLTETKGASES